MILFNARASSTYVPSMRQWGNVTAFGVTVLCLFGIYLTLGGLQGLTIAMIINVFLLAL
jgi:hypothetical protein